LRGDGGLLSNRRPPDGRFLWSLDYCRASWKRRLDEDRYPLEGVKNGKKQSTGLGLIDSKRI
jgi:hypothetical protein